jgi:hypothetical protein
MAVAMPALEKVKHKPKPEKATGGTKTWDSIRVRETPSCPK